MPSANIQIAASSDDAVQAADSTVSLTGPSINLNNAALWGGFRFLAIPIAVGSTITAATIEIERGGSATINVNIYGNDVDDAATFTTTSGNISARALTSASVNWSASLGGASGSRFDSPSIVTVIQEIVDRAGWASGNDIALIMDCLGGGIQIRTYDNNPADAAVLKLTWTTANNPPTVELDTVDETELSTLPTLAFTGTDGDGDTIHYQVQISDSLEWESGINLRDNIDYLVSPVGGLHPNPIATLTWQGEFQVDDRFGQSFTASGGILDKIVMPISIDEADTDGTAIVRLYTHAGVFGTSSAPLNAAEPEDTPTPGWLAISEAVHIDVATGPTGWIEFDFTGANRIHLEAGEHYMLMADWRPTSGIYTNVIEFDSDTTPTHSGNAYIDGDSANNGPRTDFDVKFAVFEESILIDVVSDTDDGFAGSPDNIAPFTSAQQVTFTVQAGDELDSGVTYYWRVRGSDPLGSDSWGEWSDVQSFTTIPSQTVEPNLVTSTSTVYQPVVTQALVVSLNIVTSTAIVYEPVVSPGAVTVALNRVESESVVYLMAIDNAPVIFPHLVTSTATVYEPAILPGSVTIASHFVTSAAVVYEPLVSIMEEQAIYPDMVESISVVYGMRVVIYTVSTERLYSIAYENRTTVVEA